MLEIGTTNKCIIGAGLIFLLFLLKRGVHTDLPRPLAKGSRALRKKCDARARVKCANPNIPYTSSQCWQSEFQNGSYQMNGSSNYRQITNNNLNPPNNLSCKCNAMRASETCKGSNRIDERCYTDEYNKCIRQRP